MSTISGLHLQHFRKVTSQVVEFSQPVTVIVGLNAAGKTSIVEAVALLATGQSFRADKIEEMVQLGAEYGRVKAKIVGADDEATEVEILLTRGVVQGRRTAKRLFTINGVRKQAKAAVRRFHTVVFRPEDMRLIEGSPSRRRQFLDTILSSLSVEYAHALVTYESSLRRYNRLLEQVRENQAPLEVLQYWVLQLAKYGEILQTHRQQFLASFAEVEFPFTLEVRYQPSLISLERIAEYQPRAIAAGHALIGPHKDDFLVVFFPENSTELEPLLAYGSRGQQRLGVLWLKMGELQYVRHHTQTSPILLLDDILSELDEHSRAQVLSLMANQQTIVTTADPRMIPEVYDHASAVQLIELGPSSAIIE